MMAKGKQLDRIGKELGIPRKTFFFKLFKETDESYRKRLKQARIELFKNEQN